MLSSILVHILDIGERYIRAFVFMCVCVCVIMLTAYLDFDTYFRCPMV